MPGQRTSHWTVIADVKETERFARVPVIYAIYRDGRLLYIGQTKNFRKRFNEYKCRPEFETAKVRPAPSDITERLRLEKRLIGRLTPPLNRISTGIYRRRRRAYVVPGGDAMDPKDIRYE